MNGAFPGPFTALAQLGLSPGTTGSGGFRKVDQEQPELVVMPCGAYLPQRTVSVPSNYECRYPTSRGVDVRIGLHKGYIVSHNKSPGLVTLTSYGPGSPARALPAVPARGRVDG